MKLLNKFAVHGKLLQNGKKLIFDAGQADKKDSLENELRW